MTAGKAEIDTGSNTGRRPVPDAVLLAAAFSFLLIATTHLTYLMDPDIWLHLRTGQWILENRAFPSYDTFSSRAMGQPWIAYSWLFDILVFKIFMAWGARGLLALPLVVSLSSAGWLVLFFRRFTNVRRAMILAILCFLVLLPLRTPRPWLFTISAMVVELSLLWIARETNRLALLLPLIPLFALWANLHIQFVYGLGLIGLFALDASLPSFLRKAFAAESAPTLRATPLWGLLAASVLATFANPYGWNLYRMVLEYAAQKSPMTYIQEYQAMPFRDAWDWMVLALVLAATFRLGRMPARSLLLISLLLSSCFFGFRSQRDMWFPALISAVSIAASIRKADTLGSSDGKYLSAALAVSLITGLAFVSLSGGFSEEEYRKLTVKFFPEGAVRFVKSHGLKGPLFNSYSWGDYLIWRLPGLPVSMDGRSNFYDAGLATAVATLNGHKNWNKDEDLRKARTIILESDLGLTSILKIDPRYRLLYEDETAAVFEPVNPPAPR
jgi:hypothetical protein